MFLTGWMKTGYYILFWISEIKLFLNWFQT